MEKTTVLVDFSLFGEGFNPDYITYRLGIEPSETYLKGELLKNGKTVRKRTVWRIATECEESFDIDKQLDKIMLLLRGKEGTLIELIDKFQLNAEFCVVVYIENKEVPAMFLQREFVQFMGRINAAIDFDVYA